MALRLMKRGEADLVKEFLLTAKLGRPLTMNVPGLDLRFQVTTLRKPEPVFDDMDGRSFVGATDQGDAVIMHERTSNLMLMIGKWGDSARLDASHVVLSSDHSALDFRFGQLELSNCLSDGNTMYLTKSLSRDGGEGAIVRLRRGATSLAERESRRARLAAALGDNTLWFEDQLWLVVSSLTLAELRERSSSAMTRFVGDLLRYAGQVERIRDDLDLATLGPDEVAAMAVPLRLSAQERMAIERSAMDAATSWLTRKGYRVEDVSDLRVGYDLLAHSGAGDLMVEVKGTTNEPWAVNLTANEFSTAKQNRADYLLLVVQVRDVESLEPMRIIDIVDPVHASGYGIRPTGYVLAPDVD